MQVVDDYWQQVRGADLHPGHYVCLAKSGNRVTIECEETGRVFEALNFCNNDILGLAQNPQVKAAAVAAIDQFGTSNSGCAALNGRISVHRELEQEISDFKGLPHTYLFLNAWMAMQALFDAFCHLAIPIPGFRHTRETLIFTDLSNHGCITTAVVNAGNRSGKRHTQSPEVRVKSYRHCDPDDLAKRLRRYAKPGDRIIVVTDSVFSMEGDIAPLPAFVDLLAGYPGSVLVLDEAHSSGAIGPGGGGLCEHFGLSPDAIAARGVEPVIMTTFSKFAASAGAAISTRSSGLVGVLDACPTAIGTISLPPSTAAAALEAIRQMRQHPEWCQAVQDKTVFLRNLLREQGFEAQGQTNVVPVVLHPDVHPKGFARHMLEQSGVWVSPIWYIAKPRLRVVVNALHTEQELRSLVDAMIDSREMLYPVPGRLQQRA
ncbi:MAG: aminotransferase class I/II-fold pyridoxal phosphate-dependent enzyme [Rhodospirillaceae bacterium]